MKQNFFLNRKGDIIINNSGNNDHFTTLLVRVKIKLLRWYLNHVLRG